MLCVAFHHSDLYQVCAHVVGESPTFGRLVSIKLYHHVNVMTCFTLSYLIIENKMLPLLKHTANFWYQWLKTKHYWQHLWVQYDKKTYGCAEQYISASALCIMSVMLQCYSVKSSLDICALGQGKDSVYGLNAFSKCYIYMYLSVNV